MKNLNMVRNTIPPSRKGIAHTEEHKKLLSKIAKERGFGKWMKGRKRSPDHIKKMVEASKRYWTGRKRGPISEAHRKALREKNKGHYISQATIERMRTLNKGKLGPLSHQWKVLKKRPLYKAIREVFKYREWRNSIFTRDNYTCVLCGTTKVYIEADHFPVRFVDIVRKYDIQKVEDSLNCDELWDTRNGRTLCRPCHQKTDTWGKKPRLQRFN